MSIAYVYEVSKSTVHLQLSARLDTINASLQFAIAEVIMHSDVQEKLATEVDKVLGSRTPARSDRVKLSYTEAFLCEVFRKETFAVFGVPLATTCDTTIGKYELPKGTGVLINFWALHHDPDFWENPSEFRPERFLQDNGELAPRPDSFLPFSAGKRVCLGENMAKSMLMIILPTLFQQLKFIKPDSFEFSYEDSGLANIPKPYKVCVEMRN
ncbi:hypothetical protein LSH36_561g00012 [Paralvinella palmiformis]|uniref:Cytochrome P450 n=1 Tax=Paralvinella palmiformis TaxID=53620 RepID=A0AAD9J758_9ANNE|nr:hypothetical protein LSH36_561g00012 [Paralvinella palmiformis]